MIVFMDLVKTLLVYKVSLWSVLHLIFSRIFFLIFSICFPAEIYNFSKFSKKCLASQTHR